MGLISIASYAMPGSLRETRRLRQAIVAMGAEVRQHRRNVGSFRANARVIEGFLRGTSRKTSVMDVRTKATRAPAGRRRPRRLPRMQRSRAVRDRQVAEIAIAGATRLPHPVKCPRATAARHDHA